MEAYNTHHCYHFNVREILKERQKILRFKTLITLLRYRGMCRQKKSKLYCRTCGRIKAWIDNVITALVAIHMMRQYHHGDKIGWEYVGIKVSLLAWEMK